MDDFYASRKSDFRFPLVSTHSNFKGRFDDYYHVRLASYVCWFITPMNTIVFCVP